MKDRAQKEAEAALDGLIASGDVAQMGVNEANKPLYQLTERGLKRAADLIKSMNKGSPMTDSTSHMVERCPFCGGEAFSGNPRERHDCQYFYVSCSVCAAEIEDVTEDAAIAAWNRRPSVSPVDGLGEERVREILADIEFDGRHPHFTEVERKDLASLCREVLASRSRRSVGGEVVEAAKKLITDPITTKAWAAPDGQHPACNCPYCLLARALSSPEGEKK